MIGAGNSYLAACAFAELSEQLVPCLWVRVPMLLQAVKDGFRSEEADKRARDMSDWACRVPVLFLDDLGKTHPGRKASWVEEQLYLIVDARYGNLLPTVVTTEWSQARLIERVGESVVNRLIDGAVLAGLSAPARPYRRAES